MKRSTFEQLVSEWLDSPRRGALRGRLREAVRSDPKLANVLKQWMRLDESIKRSMPGLGKLGWATFRAHLSAALDQSEGRAAGRRRQR